MTPLHVFLYLLAFGAAVVTLSVAMMFAWFAGAWLVRGVRK